MIGMSGSRREVKDRVWRGAAGFPAETLGEWNAADVWLKGGDHLRPTLGTIATYQSGPEIEPLASRVLDSSAHSAGKIVVDRASRRLPASNPAGVHIDDPVVFVQRRVRDALRRPAVVAVERLGKAVVAA